MSKHVVPYRVLIIDDQDGPSAFGRITKSELELHEFDVSHVISWDAAAKILTKKEFDFFMIDINLQAQQDGLGVLQELRHQGYNQPIALITANENCLEAPVRDYAHALASGLVSFVNKNEEGISMVDVARDMSNRVDSLRRALRLMREAGLGDEVITVNGKKITVDQLLRHPKKDDDVERALRESLNTLLLRLTGQSES